MTRHCVSILILAIVLAGLSCDAPERPAVNPWQTQWNDVLAAAKADHDVGDESRSVDRCASLAECGRRARERLFPTPAAALDPVVEQWTERAEWLGSNCPAAHGDYAEQRVALSELRILEAEIQAGLEAVVALQREESARVE